MACAMFCSVFVGPPVRTTRIPCTSRRVISDLGVVFRAPIAPRVTRAWADNQRGSLIIDDLRRIVACISRQRNIPAQHPVVRTERLGKPKEGVHHMFALARRNAMRSEQPLQLARSCPIETELHRRTYIAAAGSSHAARAACAAAGRNAARAPRCESASDHGTRGAYRR